MSDDVRNAETEVDHSYIELHADAAIKRLDHVWETIETVQKHASAQADIDALDDAQDQLEEAQADIQEIEGELDR